MRPRDALYVALASAAFFLSYFSRLAWGVLSDYSSLRPTPAESGLVVTYFFLTYVAVQVPAGLVSDSLGPKRVLLASLAGLAASSALNGMAWSIEAEYMTSALMGFSAGWIYPATVKLISQRFKGADLSRAMGYYSLAWPLSMVMVGATMPAVAEELGWRWGYFLIAIAAAAVAAASTSIAGSSTSARGNSLNIKVLGERDVMLLAAGGFAFYLAYWTFAFYAYSYLTSIGIGAAEAGLIYSLSAVAGFASTVFAGYLIARIGLRITFTAFMPLYGATLAAFALTRSPLLLAAVSLAMGFFRFVITPANSTAAGILRGSASAGSVSGAANLFWQLSGAASGVIAPLLLYAAGYEALWIAMGALAALAAVPYNLMSGLP